MQLSSRFAYRVSALALASTICFPAFAQDAAQEQPETNQSGGSQDEQVSDEVFEADIIVTASRMRGSVDTDVAPVVELDEADIASYGADSIADLVAQLGPQTSSGRGRGGQPVVLVNGQRVASFRELRRYPPEAIQKVEVFPEEVALQYGFRADQRVINFILKDNFTSREIEVEYGGSLEGGTDNGEIEVSQLVISGAKRFNIAGEFNTQTLLTEDERDIEQTPGSQPTVAGDPDPAPFRSLRADAESYQLEGSFNTAIGEGANAKAISVNLAAEQNYSRSLSGLDIVTLTSPAPDSETAVRAIDADPLTRMTRTTSVSGGGAYRQSLGEFEFDLTLDASHVESETDIDIRRDLSPLVMQAAAGTLAIDGPLPAIPTPGIDTATSRTTSASARSTLRGSPIFLPAGELNMTFAGGYGWTRIVSEDTRTALGENELTRGDLNGSLNLNIPLASDREGFLGFLGELSFNASGEINDLSDFGTLFGSTLGLTWEPLEGLTLQATAINREAAPGLSQLGDPVVQTFNVPLFDFATGENVLATLTSGGNPLLPASNLNDLKLSANYDLGLFERTNILVEFNRNRSENTTESFPLLTQQIEAAFPGRVTRDGSGTLIALDQRPITYAERNSERIRYGFNMFGRVGKAQEAPLGGGEGRRGGGPPAGVSSGSGQTRMGPEQFQQMRDQFCASEPGTVPDLSKLPPFIRDRLTNEDGTVNMERLAAVRERFCNAEGAQPGAGGGGPGMFDPEQAAAIRQALCTTPDQPLDLSALPEGLRARLTNEDGTVNEERVARLREAVCQGENGEGAQGQGESSGNQRRGGGRRGGGRGGDDGQGRWFLSAYHSIELKNEALIAPGIPTIDYFDLGLARHSVDLEGGVFYKGLGTRLSGRYRSGYTIEGSDPTGASDLKFGDLVTFDLRFFMNLEEQKWLTGEQPGFFKGTRVSLSMDNIFNTRQDVVDGNGVTPTRFQPALIDPLGRTFEIEFRKLF